MTQGDAQRFNLVFAGQLSPGTDPARARLLLTAFFRRKDPASMEVFFSGRPLPLRRNLLHKDALQLQSQLRQHGLICEIPPVDRVADAAPVAAPAPAPEKPRQRLRAGVARRDDAGAVAPPKRATAAKPAANDPPPPKTETAAPIAPEPAAHAPAAPNLATLAKGPAPNLFALRPALTPRPDATDRERQRLRVTIAGGIALALVFLVVAVALRFPPAPPGEEPVGPLAAAGGARGELLMLLPGALLLHERSGLARGTIAAATLGVERLAAPLLVTADDDLVVGTVDATGSNGLLRCNRVTAVCEAVANGFDARGTPAVAESYLGDALFLLAPDGRLLRSDGSGSVLADTALPVRADQRLAYHDGLLLAPTADAPLLGIFRPDPTRFGEQIDALLLAPPGDADDPVNRIRDMALLGDARFAILERASGTAALYRFDRQWGAARGVASDVGPHAYLATWRDRVLLADPSQATALRFTADGRREADFNSSLLADARSAWRQALRERTLQRRVGIVLPLSVAVFALLYALLEASVLRGMASHDSRGTKLLDPLPGGIHWLPPADARRKAARRLGLALIVTALLPAVSAIATSAWTAAACLLPVVLGSLYARGAIDRGSGGHLGLRDGSVILIDHDGRYFYGDRRLLRSGLGFLFAPGVALPVAVKGLPTMHGYEAAAATAASLDAAGCLGLLWQQRHPWFLAVLVAAGSVLTSGACWLFVA